MTIFVYGILGPPGSGKSSFCREVGEVMKILGRKVKLIDLDPANETPCYTSDESIRELIKVEEVMDKQNLGFNAALLYCLEFLETNVDWLMNKIKSYEKGTFVVIDLPGQVELFIHNNALKTIFEMFGKQGFLMATIYLVDSFCCSDPGNFIAFLITTLMSMTHLELPRVNVLSKVDLIPANEKKLAFGLDFYTQVLDLDKLVALVDDDPITGRYKKLTKVLAGVIERYGLVQFAPLSLQDKDSIIVVLKLIDKAVGYSAIREDHLMESYVKVDNEIDDLTAILNEKYVLPKVENIPIGLVGRIRERDANGKFVDEPQSGN